MSDQPLVSIIIPTYNRAHLIGETLDSVLAQTYLNWECIIVDDGSSDNTDELIGEYVQTDSRFKYYHRPEEHLPGGNGARNYGFKMSKGEYVNWFDSDDLMVAEKILNDLETITTSDYDFTICQSKFFSHDGVILQKEYWNNKLWSDDPINDFIMMKIGWSPNSPLWMKSSLKNNNLVFDERLKSGQDYLFHIQCLRASLRPRISQKVLVKIREHSYQIRNYKDKSSSKAIIYDYILENSDKLGINTKCIFFIYDRALRSVSKLFKSRKLKGYKMSVFYLKRINNLKFSLILFRLNIFGTFYYLTYLGYSKINLKLFDSSLKP
jgi:glycosyltransferase involved in cell wall biosynthesis